MTSPSRKVSFPALTGARFFAAFAVVVVHFGGVFVGVYLPSLAATVAAGPLAVSLFYVLSGAVLTWGSTTSEGLPLRSARTFWVQRGARIAPVYLLALLFAFLPFTLQVFSLHGGAAAVTRVLVALVASGLAVQAFVPQVSTGLNTPSWSISCEAFFYALWPRLVVWLKCGERGFPWRRCALLWVPALFPTFLGVGVLYLGGAPEGPFATTLEGVSGTEILRRFCTYFPPLRLAEFAMGITLGHALKSTPLPETRSKVRDTLAELALLAALFGAATALGGGLVARLTGVELATRISVESGILAPLFALLVWQLARGQGMVQRLLSFSPLITLGEASYGLYILQDPVLVWFSAALKRAFPAFAARWEHGFIVYVALLVPLSVVVHRFIEIPLRRALLARLAPKPTVPAQLA